MDKGMKDKLVIAGSAWAGGVGGSWGAARLGAALGLRLGPWGAVAGSAIGALAGVVLARIILERNDAVSELKVADELEVDEK